MNYIHMTNAVDQMPSISDTANGSCTYIDNISGYGYADGIQRNDNPMKGDGGSNGSQCRLLKTLCGSGISEGRMVKGFYKDSPY